MRNNGKGEKEEYGKSEKEEWEKMKMKEEKCNERVDKLGRDIYYRGRSGIKR